MGPRASACPIAVHPRPILHLADRLKSAAARFRDRPRFSTQTSPASPMPRTDVGGAYRLDTATQPLDRPQRRRRRNRTTSSSTSACSVIGLDPNDANPRLHRQRPIRRRGKLETSLPASIARPTAGATWTYTTPGFKMGGNGEGRGTGERMVVDPLHTARTCSSAPATPASGAAIPTTARPGHE